MPSMSGYRPQAADTTEAMDRLQFEGIRRMTPAERLATAMRSFRALERLQIAGLRLRFPDASEEELRRRAGARRLGRETVLRFFGPAGEQWLD